MSSSTQSLRRVPFSQVTPNVPRVTLKHDCLIVDAPAFVPKRTTTYTPEELTSFRANAVPFFVPHTLRELFAAPAARPKTREVETNPQRLAMRQKQISYGKATEGYRRYVELVPRARRAQGDPKTPDETAKCSKRCWDGQVRKWRRALHAFDAADTGDLDDVRRQLAVINATPNKIRVPFTDPVHRQSRIPPDVSLPRRLTFEDLGPAEC